MNEIPKNDRKAINHLKMQKIQNKNCTIEYYIPWIKFLSRRASKISIKKEDANASSSRA